MKIEVINTGTELLLGTTLNTHGAWIGTELLPLGLRVARQTTVPDGDPIGEALREALPRCDAIIVTGGLGPTSDDVTCAAVAEVIGVELVEDGESLRSIESFFAKLGRPMAESNRKQALVPAGAEVLPNPNGTAPGVYVGPQVAGTGGCALFLLPGPPRELQPMFHAEVLPRLRERAGVDAARGMTELRFTGIGESDFHQGVDEELAGIAGLEVGYCARPGEVDLRLIGDEEARQAGRAVAERAFHEQLVSDDGSTLEQRVVALLRERGWSLAIAESCTGGLIASRVTDVPGASEVFTHGFVSYANEAKVGMLGVPEELLAAHGAVSEEVVRAMAEGALRAGGADVAVAVTGIAGPGGGSEDKPVGTVFLGLAVKGRPTRVRRRVHARGRTVFKRVVSQAALEMVRRVAESSTVAETSRFRSVKDGLRQAAPRESVLHSPKAEHSATPELIFRPFDDDGGLTRSKGALPHWSQPGATHFVTFRLHDSLPREVAVRWHRQREQWLELRGESAERKGWFERLSPDHRREYVMKFGRTFEREIDRGHGSCLLRKETNAKILEQAMEHFDGMRYALGDYVVMPNHVHVLLVPAEGWAIQDILKSWKSFSAREINRAMARSGPVWQRESFDHVVRNRRQFERLRDYIAENPKKANLPEGDFRLRVAEWGE